MNTMFKDRKRKRQAARRNVKKLLQNMQSRYDSDSCDSDKDSALKELPGKRKGILPKTSLSSDNDDDEPAKKVCRRMTTKAKTNKTGEELKGYDSKQEVGFPETPTYSGRQRISNGKQSSNICSKESSDTAVLTSRPCRRSTEDNNISSLSVPANPPSPIMSTPKFNDARSKSHSVTPNTSDMCVLFLRKLDYIEQSMTSLITDVARLKAVLIKRIPEEEDHTELLAGLQKFTNVETFEAFCTRLKEETNFRKMFVNHCIQMYSFKDIGNAVRSILKTTMSDELMAQYNRTGTLGKKLFPQIFLICISKCVRHFHKDKEVEVRRGRETIKTTIDREITKQVEIYLSNAKTRIKLQEARLTRVPDNIALDSDL